MSINKVLNRPMFRNAALKKGHLKPIKANVGRFVYNARTGTEQLRYPPVPTNVKPPQPGFFTKLKADIGGIGRNIKDPRFLISAPFGMGGGLTRTAGAFGLYPLIEEVTRKGGLEGPGKAVADLGISAALSKNPYAVGAGLLYGGYRASRPLVGRMVDLVKERPLGTTASNPSFMPGVEGVLGKPIEKTPFEEMVKNYQDQMTPKTSDQLSVASGRGAGSGTSAVGYEKFRTAIKPKDKLTEEDNVAAVDDSLIDIDKVVQNQEPFKRPNISDVAGKELPKIKKPKPSKITEEKETDLDIITKGDPGKDTTPGTVTQGDGTLINDRTIARARQLYEQLNKGEASQAKLVFLANLASGLMTGTTQKGGLGGALEVMGQALGPAVNNYAVMKMKENELERNSMETYLGYALDEMKLFNEAAAGEPFEGDKGIIQFIDENGVTRNVKGRETKAGTMEVATGRLDDRGNMIYMPVGAAGIEGYGTPVQFFDKKTVDSNTQKVGETLSNRYKTYKIANDVLDILDEQPTAGGPRGAIALFTNRFGGALSDVFGRSSSTKEEAKALYDQMRAKIEANDEIGESEKKFLLKKLDFNDVYKEAEKRIKNRAGDIDSDTLEKLAVAETTLVYALANSFKDQDRLTQRDVQAAEKLVNLFTLTRGSEATRSSIKAIAEELESDILRYENDYRRLGGLEITLNSMRQQNKFRPQEGTGISESMMKKYDEMSSEDLMKDYNL